MTCVPPKSSRVPSARSSQLRATAPDDPPSRPKGAMRRRSPRIAAVIASRKRTRRTAPSPPRHLPAPPEQYRKAPLQHFGIGEPGVGHVRVDRRRAVEARTGAGSAADGLVILVARVTEGEVVHRALRG